MAQSMGMVAAQAGLHAEQFGLDGRPFIPAAIHSDFRRASRLPANFTSRIPPRVLVQGISNGTKVYTQDNGQTVEGEFVVLAEPYAMTVNQYQIITGIQKTRPSKRFSFLSQTLSGELPNLF